MDRKGKQEMVMERVVKKEIGLAGETSDDEGYEGQLTGCAEHDTENNKKKRVLMGGGGRKASGGGSGGNGVIKCCQAERCTADLSHAKPYHRRHKVCEHHSKAQVVLVDGIRQRFCQQCSRFHELTEFDETKRSCRRRLAGHNERRRKNFSETHTEGSSRKGTCTELKDVVCGQVDNKERIKIAIQEHAPCKHFHMR